VTLPEARVIARRLAGDAEVEYVQPDRRMRAQFVPDDQYLNLQTYLRDDAAAIGAFTAWDVTTGSASTVVAVVAVVAGAGAGLSALFGRLGGGSGTSASAGGLSARSGRSSRQTKTATRHSAKTRPSTSSAPPGTAVGKASAVPVGQAGQFTDPASGQPAWLVHPAAGTFVAFSAV